MNKGIHVLTYPTHLKIETVQGCNRYCDFCTVSHKRTERKLMKLHVFKTILQQMDQRVKRIDFSLHGEPLLNENIDVMICTLRARLPKVQISIISNIEKLLIDEKGIDQLINLFKAGLNFLHADTYTHRVKSRFIEILKANKERFIPLGIQVRRFTAEGINIWGYNSSTIKMILLNDESLGFQRNAIRKVHSCGGNLAFEFWEKYDLHIEDYPWMKPCTEPLRTMPIDIYGNVLLCCADNNKSLFFGNLKESSAEEIWNSEKLNKARFLLSKGRRDCIPACYFCNKRSFRTGLWPYTGPSFDIPTIKEELWADSKISTNLHNLFERIRIW